MYRIVCSDGTVLYDQSYTIRTDLEEEYTVHTPKLVREVGQPGSLSFTMMPGHVAYNRVANMKTYLSAEEDGEELFYGRIIDIQVDKITGIKEIHCAGALNFLDDSEIAPFDETTMTCQQFLQRCIDAHNTDIGNDANRTITLGIVSHSKASEVRKFKISSYTKTRNAIDTYLVKDFGGFIRIRKTQNGHVLDWVESYSESNDSPIEIGYNIASQQNSMTSNELFTVLRPVGEKGIALDEVTIDISQELVQEYGRIVRSVSFSNAKTKEDLRAEAERYIRLLNMGVGSTATIKVVDMHFLDGTVPRIRLGAVYTSISGFQNEPMIIASLEQIFDNPGEDAVTFKNEKELSAKGTGSSGRGSFSKVNDGPFKNIYNHITETQNSLSIHADLIELHGKQITETAEQFERYSRRTDDAIGTIQGTGVIQNSDAITQAAGTFKIKYYRVPDSKLEKQGCNPANYGYYEFQSYVVQEEDINSGIELYGSETAALSGNALNTSNLTVGETEFRMVRTQDTTPLPGSEGRRFKKYYTRGVGIGTGTEFYMDEDGMHYTVGELKTTTDTMNNEIVNVIEGSTIWQERNNITDFVGEFEVVTDQQTGEKTLKVKTGGGIVLLKDQVEYGLYHDGNLTGGVLVTKLNDETTTTKILGDRVDITASQLVEIGVYTEDNLTAGVIAETLNGDSTAKINFANLDSSVTDYTALGLFDDNTLTAGVLVSKLSDGTTTTVISSDYIDLDASQIRIGDTSNVEAWCDDMGEDFDTLEGIVADKATIADLDALTGRIETLETDALTAGGIESMSLSCLGLWSPNGDWSISIDGEFFGETARVTGIALNGSEAFYDCIIDAEVDSTTNIVTLTKASGETVTFSKAIAPTLSGWWSNGTITVSSTPSAVDNFVETLSTGPKENQDGTAYTGGNEWYVPINALFGSQSQYSESTGWRVYVNAQSRYDAGHTDGLNDATVSLSDEWSGATYTVTAIKNGVTQSSITKSTTLYAKIASESGNNAKIYPSTWNGTGYDNRGNGTDIYVVQSGTGSSAKAQIKTVNSSASGTAYAELDIGTLYTDGHTDGLNDATVSLSDEWSGATYTVTAIKNGVTQPSITKSTTLYAKIASESGNNAKIYPSTWNGTGYDNRGNGTDIYVVQSGTGSSAKAQIKTVNSSASGTAYAELDIGTLYTDGYSEGSSVGYSTGYAAGVAIGTATGAAGAGLELDTANNKVKRSLSSETKEYAVSVDVTGEWSSGSKTVYAKLGDTQMASGSIGVPAVTATNWVNTQDRKWRADVTIGGVTRSSDTKNFGGYYTDGWSGCYGTVGISPTAQQNLGYGGSVTVYAQAKASSGASSKTNVASVKVTAPADNQATGWTNCYNTVGISPSTAQTVNPGGSVTVYAQAKASSGASSKTNVANVKVTGGTPTPIVSAASSGSEMSTPYYLQPGDSVTVWGGYPKADTTYKWSKAYVINAPGNPFCAHSGNTEMSQSISLSPGQSYDIWAGNQYGASSSATYKWSKKYTISADAIVVNEWWRGRRPVTANVWYIGAKINGDWYYSPDWEF